MPTPTSLALLHRDINSLNTTLESCRLCPRLRSYCLEVGEKKKREFKEETYWTKPVGGFGDPSAWLWVIGLAPAAHGANRTGRVFTGDRSGEWLYRELFEAGLANQPSSSLREDGLTLKGAYVSCVVRCAPPKNKPSRDELNLCHTYLTQEFQLLSKKNVILALGKIAFEESLALLSQMNYIQETQSKKPTFAHGIVTQFHSTVSGHHLTLVASYHPSQQNTFTGVLSREMFKDVFLKAKQSYRIHSSH